MTNWKSATCETCIYRTMECCYRFPPNRDIDGSSFYPDITYVTGEVTSEGEQMVFYQPACAEYTEEGQPTPFERAAKLAVDKGAVAAMDAMTASHHNLYVPSSSLR